MSDGWRELGVRAELIDAAAAHGFDTPSALQRAAVPVLRRGGNAMLHASYGAGVTAAYGIALLDRTAESGGTGAPRVLVITPTGARAATAADELAALAGGLPVRVAALTPGWREAETADVVVGSLANVAGAIGRSALKLEALQAIVLESLSTLLAEDGRASLDTVMTAVPREAQRVVTSAADDTIVDRFVEEHARRAMRIPARSADRTGVAGEPVGETHYLVVPEYDKDDALARLLVRSSGEDVLVSTRSTRRAEQVRTMLRARGHDVAAGALRVESATEAPPRGARVIAYDPPMDAATLAHLHTGAGVVLVTPGELAHLRLLAAEANVALRAEKARAGDRDVGAAFRAEIRQALQERDLDAQLLLLDPLFDEYSAAEVAAALSALLRERRPGGARAGAERTAAPGPAEAAPGAAGAPATFTRLFLSIGSRDGIRAGDLVGAITGEAGITGAEVGRIDLRDTFSVVEVAADAAERVIRALNGTTMRGRALRVDYDRRGATTQKERAGGPRERGRAGPGAGDRPRRPRPDGGERARRPRRDTE